MMGREKLDEGEGAGAVGLRLERWGVWNPHVYSVRFGWFVRDELGKDKKLRQYSFYLNQLWRLHLTVKGRDFSGRNFLHRVSNLKEYK